MRKDSPGCSCNLQQSKCQWLAEAQVMSVHLFFVCVWYLVIQERLIWVKGGEISPAQMPEFYFATGFWGVIQFLVSVQLEVKKFGLGAWFDFYILLGIFSLCLFFFLVLKTRWREKMITWGIVLCNFPLLSFFLKIRGGLSWKPLGSVCAYTWGCAVSGIYLQTAQSLGRLQAGLTKHLSSAAEPLHWVFSPCPLGVPSAVSVTAHPWHFRTRVSSITSHEIIS